MASAPRPATIRVETTELEPTGEALLDLLSDVRVPRAVGIEVPLSESASLTEADSVPDPSRGELVIEEDSKAEAAPTTTREEDPLGSPSFPEPEDLLSRTAEPSGLSALLADGFGKIEKQVAPPQPSPGRSNLADMLADGFRQLDHPRDPAPAPRPALTVSGPHEAPEDALDPTASSLQPAAGGGLAAFLADGFSMLESPVAPVPRPAPAPRPAQIAPPRPDPPEPALPVNPSLAGAAEIAGLIGVALVDSDSGLLLASQGRGLDLEAVAAFSTQFVLAEQQAMRSLALDDRIDDILVTMGRQLHVIRPLQRMPAVFLFLALDRRVANLGMARIQLERIEASLAG